MTEQQAMFEAICDVFGWKPDVLPKTARTRVGKVARELREVGATPEMVAYSRTVLDRQFGVDTTWGPEAILLWWGEIERRWAARRRFEAGAAQEAEAAPYESPPLPLAENRRRWRRMIARYGEPAGRPIE